MGSCACIPKVTKPSIRPIPNLQYFHLEDGSLMEIRENTPQIRNLGSLFSTDSAILMRAKQLLVVGGSSPDYSSDVSLVDTESLMLYPRASLPVRSRLGQLYEFEDWVYYIGGLTPHRKNGKEEPTPLMRYNFRSDEWEILHVNIEAIAYPGTFVFGNKLYMVGGLKRDNKKRIKRNKTVFSIDLARPQDLTSEEGRLPLEMLSPHCIVREGFAIIAGGKTSEELPLRKVFMYDLTSGCGFRVFPDLPVNLTRNHPPFYNEKSALFFAYPKVLALFGNDEWQVFDISFKAGYFPKNLSAANGRAKGESLNRCVTISTVLETTRPKVTFEEAKDKSDSFGYHDSGKDKRKSNEQSEDPEAVDFSQDSDPEILIPERIRICDTPAPPLSNEQESLAGQREAPHTWSFSSGSENSSLEIKEVPIMVDPFTFEEDVGTGNPDGKIMISGTIEGYWNLKNTKALLEIIDEALGLHKTHNLSLLKEWDFEACVSVKVICDVVASMLKNKTYSKHRIEKALINISQEFGSDRSSTVFKRHQVSSENLVLSKQTILKMLKSSIQSIDFSI